MNTTYLTSTPDETIALGERVARDLPRRGVVLLIGNLGAAGPDDVTSPTFTLIHEYGGGRVHHVDLYRLDDPRQVANLGLDDLIEESLVLIEWGERFPQLMPARRTEIGIRALEGDERQIEVIERS